MRLCSDTTSPDAQRQAGTLSNSTQVALHGSSGRTLRAGAYSVSLASLADGTRLPRHAHERATLNIVLKGRYGETIERGKLQLHGPATLIAKPAGAAHENVVGSAPVECLVVNMGTRDLHDVTIRRSADVARLAGKLRVELTCRPDDGRLVAEELINALLESVECNVAPSARLREPWLEVVRELLHDGPALQSLDDLGNHVNRHPVYIARAFRARFGKSIGEYVRCIRLERARCLLHDDKVTLSEVALSAGYSDQSHMTRDFQREFRVSPGAYRKCLRLVR